MLTEFYNQESNWSDPAKYQAAMAMKQEAYTQYDSARWFTTFSADETQTQVFEAGTGALIYGIPFYVVWAIPLYFAVAWIPILGQILFVTLFFGASFADLWILLGATGTNSNYPGATLYGWFPDELEPPETVATA